MSTGWIAWMFLDLVRTHFPIDCRSPMMASLNWVARLKASDHVL